MKKTGFLILLFSLLTIGFNPGKVAKTPQNVEVVKGEVIAKP